MCALCFPVVLSGNEAASVCTTEALMTGNDAASASTTEALKTDVVSKYCIVFVGRLTGF